MKLIDNFLSQITMYRLTLYVLIGLVAAATFFSFNHSLAYKPLDVPLSAAFLVIFCWLANLIFAKLFRAGTNIESVFITALILTLIVPAKFPQNLGFLILVSGFSMASKYLVTVEKRHLFNPAAAALVAVALLSPEHVATWWVGTKVMFPFVLVGGLLIMRKIRREGMLFTFFLVYLFVLAASAYWHNQGFSGIFHIWQTSFLNSALLFFALIMFTEPLTTPSTKDKRSLYSALVAVLYATPQIRLFGLIFTPEQALLLGNIYSFIVNPKYRLSLSLFLKKQLSADTFAFAFASVPGFNFVPGQYMEWTLPHPNADDRGNRRYFSLASSPTEENPLIAVKFYEKGSSYKRTLRELQSGQPIIASSLAGDFTLPKDLTKPLVFIAGGVGIAPFRSMVRFILDKNLKTDIILLYSNRKSEDILFANIFEAARPNGVRTVYTLTDRQAAPAGWAGELGYVTSDFIEKKIPDYKKRTFYLSGPQPMVKGLESMLSKMGVSGNKIITDYFPGYSE